MPLRTQQTAPEVAYSLDHLGALAAHWVLGWELCDDPDCKGCDCPIYLFGSQGWRVIEPSTMMNRDGVHFLRLAEDIGDAWRLVEAMAKRGWHCEMERCHEDYSAVLIFDENHEFLGGQSGCLGFPATVCSAALHATGHPVRLELGEEG